MRTPSKDELRDALVMVARERIIRDLPVDIPGLGILAVEHRAPEVRPSTDEAVFTPPRDSVAFVAAPGAK